MNLSICSQRCTSAFWFAATLLLILPRVGSSQGTKADYERATTVRQWAGGKTLNAKIDVRWAPESDELWYQRDLPNGKHEFVLVDAARGTRTVVPEDKLPKNAKSSPPQTRRGDGANRGAQSSATSPDGKWTAFVRESNLWMRDRSGRTEVQLSLDANAGDSYGEGYYWSPDSSRLIAVRTQTGGDRKVTLVESSPKTQLQPRTSTYNYLKPGDAIPLHKPHLFDVKSKREIPVSDQLFPNPWEIGYEHWSPDSQRFYFVYNQRGHTVMRLLAIDAATGTVTPIVNEECKTFFDYNSKLFARYLDETHELIWMSERDGWNHLFLIDLASGAVKNTITPGKWVVRGVDRIDEKNREIWFRAMGLDADQDPYHVHFCRVKFDGTGLVRLTEGDGTHTISYSPDRRYYVDAYSRVDLPPVAELRRTSDGKKICGLEEADPGALLKTGWTMPERFVAKGRDGKTDIHGIIVRPSNFKPDKKYPVIEYIYAGPHDFHVPKTYGTAVRMQSMAELGFIIVQIDGMGTNWRSKAFHDVCWKNIGDAGFPDRIPWIKAAAAKHPEMDISKGVGIFGGSAGGQNTLRGMTEYPDFYVVGVADCGCHDNRMDKIWWNELWMSWPIGPHYAEQSNVTNAHKLKGKLMLVVGELDHNVDPASTMQVVNALIKADKDFELLVVPGADHGAAESPYGNRRRMDFFVRNLLGVEPRRTVETAENGQGK
jgi:dipeptidyl aminopeptidase/acylaminoacyl peptidase